MIEYYYNIRIEDLYKKNKKYKFKSYNSEYLFLPLNRYEKEIIEINELIKENNNYDQIIPNIEKKLITPSNGQYYILVKKTLNQEEIENCISKFSYVIVPRDFYKTIDRSNWYFLWTEKIDYIEYQQIHIDKSYPLLRNSVNYFIGMGENAVSYIYNIYQSNNFSNEDLVIAHKRIKKEGFNNPLNLIVDHKSRDIAEYLKYLFFHQKYDYIKIKQFLVNLNLDQFSSQLLYGRMLFPTYYFDMYDAIINKNVEENKILEILKKIDEYEDYIANIYSIISQNLTIDRVGWL